MNYSVNSMVGHSDYHEKEENFRHKGINCKIVKTSSGHWCGYVKLPEKMDHVQWRSIPEDGEIVTSDIQVYGGITYGPDGEGWIGFDDNHPSSIVNHRKESSKKEAVKSEVKRLAEQINSFQK